MNIHYPLLATAAFLMFACNNQQNTPPPPNPEDQITTIQCTEASLVYYGDMDGIEISNLHKLTLYTSMQINDQGYPIGPGTMIRLSLNTSLQSDGSTDITLPAGEYLAAQSSQDFDPFTFNAGYTIQMDLPEGKVEMPDGSFYGEIPDGKTEFPADLLADGKVTVTRNNDGTYTITGVVAGDKYMKRYFTYTGKLNVVDRSQGDVKVENTTLTANLTLNNLTKARIEDRGDNYFLGDESCRVLNLYLAESTIDLSDTWAAGSGNLLQIELFVPFSTDVANGIPAGTYNVTTRTQNNGMSRENIIPFNIAPGYPDKFTNAEGAWFFKYENGKSKEFARIDGGVMKVTRNGDAHQITIEFTDCAKTPNKVSTTFNQSTPIEVYKFSNSQPQIKDIPLKTNKR